MIAVVSRVKYARLSVEGKLISSIGKGFLIYVCAEKGDIPGDCEKLAHKCAGLRIFEDADGKMNLNLDRVGGDILVVSNFTLAGKMGSGFRPGFSDAMEPAEAALAVERFVDLLRQAGQRVQTGIFGADMQIENQADGPITLLLRARDGKMQ